MEILDILLRVQTNGTVPYVANLRLNVGTVKTEISLLVTDEVIRDHLTGKHIIGVYPLLFDETCWFLAIDFDKKTWQEDVVAFLNTSGEMECTHSA